MELPVDRLRPNRFQPRQEFQGESLEQLALSIREHGVLQPVVVRPAADGYELVAGERRWRAAQAAGLAVIPALVRTMGDREAAELALVENLQREDLHFFEEAEGLKRLLEEFQVTQEELAARLGKSQSAVANKVRLLRLSPAVRREISREMLSERQARALLRLSSEKDQLAVVREVSRRGLNVRETEALVERLVRGDGGKARQRGRRRVVRVYKDLRLFVNGLGELVKRLRETGLAPEVEQQDGEEWVEFRIRIPKRRPQG